MLPVSTLLDYHKNPQKSSKPLDARRLINYLDTLGVHGEIYNSKAGVISSTLEFIPSKGTRFKQIVSVEQDIALCLGAQSVRVNRDKNKIIIEVFEATRRRVGLRELLENPEFYEHIPMTANSPEYGLHLALGMTNSGPLVINLCEAPHLLIGGCSGAGKSVCLHAATNSLLYRYGPNQLQMGMIDVKRLELNSYESLPHVSDYGVAYTPQDGIHMLDVALLNIHHRYEVLAQLGFQSHADYLLALNRLPKELPAIPYLVLIIDEFAELIMMDNRVGELISRIGQLGRAAGAHLVLASQRPEVKVTSGLTKANMGSRIAFRTNSSIDSKIILDQTGAESLLGEGDGIFTNGGFPTRFQGAFISKREVNAIVSFINQH